MVSQAELILSLFGSWSYLNFFRDGMGPFNFIGLYTLLVSGEGKIGCCMMAVRTVFLWLKVVYSQW